ncbi:MAG: (2E,6E)-farnesyl diphosphate synthase [Proteobacteria bacterium]|nr:(2E,6E)-farnesyl diphosphate synthase [Pseudomonadota bacterium]
MSEFSERLQVYQQSVETALDHWLPGSSIQPEKLHAAMRYSVLGDGKRIRPVILYATGEAFGIELDALDGPASAVEIIHAYSLIHDDLPSMDDDDLRRGRATCHKEFNEATAILAGDALQALAFHILAHDPKIKVNSQQRLSMIETLAIASGSRGMAGGQAIDLASVGISLNIAELENMHIHKTGALIRASAELGALSAEDVEPKLFSRISQYAKCMGLAFQIKDDILDIESDTETLGKPQGSDMAMNKPTYPNLLGLDGAKQAANDLHSKAIKCLDAFDEQADMLRTIADYIVKRNK